MHFGRYLLYLTLSGLLLLTTTNSGGQEYPSYSNAIKDSAFKNIFPIGSAGWIYSNSQDAPYLNQLLSKVRYLEYNGNNDAAQYWYCIALGYIFPGSSLRLDIYNSLTVISFVNGEYEKALNMYYKVMTYTVSDYERAVNSLRINPIFVWLRDDKKAMRQLDEALAIFEKENNLFFMALTLSRKGGVYWQRNNLEQWSNYNFSAYRLIEHIGINKNNPSENDKKIASLRNSLLVGVASIYLSRNQPDSALFYLDKVDLDGDDGQSVESRLSFLLNMGQGYMLKKEKQKAIYYFNKGKAIMEQPGNRALYMDAALELSNCYEQLGLFNETSDLLRQYINLKDSLVSVNAIHRINALETQARLAQKDRELAQKELLLEKQASRTMEAIWLSVCMALALISFTTVFLLSRKNHRNKQKLLSEKLSSAERERKMEQIEAGVQGEEKERMRIARELHDGVVSELMAIKLNLKTIEHKHPELKQSVDYSNILYQSDEVMEKLRRTAHNLMPLRLKENGLISAIDAFLNRINSHKIQLSFQHFGTLPELKDETGKMVLLMVMELIQNMIKHAQATEGLIQFHCSDGTLCITVEDNGVGIREQPPDGKGMGLANLKDNVRLLKGSIDIKGTEYTGTTVLIEIPLGEHTLYADEAYDRFQ